MTDAVFSFGERAGDRPGSEMGRYNLNIEYGIEIYRNHPDWVGEPGIGRPPRLPCIGPAAPPLPGLPGGIPSYFPLCPGIPGEGVYLEIPHPVDPVNPRCIADGPGCREPFLVSWPAGFEAFDVFFTSDAELSFELFDTAQNLIGEADPWPQAMEGSWPSPRRLGARSLTAAVNQITQRLYVPQLEPGLYVLVVSGPEAGYSVDYILPSAVELYLPLIAR